MVSCVVGAWRKWQVSCVVAPAVQAISVEATAVLQAFGERSGFTLDEVPAACPLTRSRAAEAVAELVAAGIASDDGDAYAIRFGSHSAIQGLLRAREGRAGSELDSGLINARAALDGVLVDQAKVRTPRVVKITDLAVLAKHLDQLARLTRNDLISLHAGEPPRQETLERSVAADVALLERGVKLRIVFPMNVLAEDYVRDYVERMQAMGTEIRFADTLPHRLIVSDAIRAVVPIDRSDLRVGALITSEPLLTGGLRHLAGTLFRRGRRLSEVNETTMASGPTSIELRMIEMMSSGVTDDVAARRLCVSERTFRRHTVSLLERLGATSRFQAGIRAVERGWI
jgi:DNA-binding CsgD family transcriptional regulator